MESPACQYTLLYGHPTYHVNVIKLKCEITWTDGLPPLHGVPHFHVTGPYMYIEDFTEACGETKFLFSSRLKVKYFLTREVQRNSVPSSCNVMFYLSFQHQGNTKPFHFNVLFTVKGMIYHVTIPTVIFSRGKMPCYCHM